MLRPVKIRNYIGFMEGLGFTAAETLRGSGIRERQLDDPSYLIDRVKCEVVIANMMRLTGNQAIGFEIGKQARLDHFGVVALAMRTSHTLDEGIEYWVRYSNLVGMLIHHTLLEGPRREWSVVFTATQPLGFIYNFCVEEILQAGVQLGSEMVNLPLAVKEVSLSYPAPLHAHLYRKYMGCPVHFNASCTSITVKSPPLSSILKGYDKELNEVYRRHCREVHRLIGNDDPFAARIQSLLLNDPAALPDLDTAAQRLGVSSRTLRRNLLDEGTSFQQLLNRFRMERCIDYLRGGQLSVKEIAGMLGFEDSNSLRRAFKSWTGTTLGDSREQLSLQSPAKTATRTAAGKMRRS